MKRRDILKEGGNHTKVYKDGVFVSAISRQTEIKETIVKAIERQTRTKLR